jgi:hypothetical protein
MTARKATLIKLDVEGYEAEVLAGAGDVLTAPTVIAVETEAQGEATSRGLTRAGFVRRWYDPWSRTLLQAQPGNLNASNALRAGTRRILASHSPSESTAAYSRPRILTSLSPRP